MLSDPAKQLIEKSRECHNHKPQPTPDTKRKRKMTKTSTNKTNKQMHPVIMPYNKLSCINHFQPPSRPSCQWKPNFKQRFHQIHSVNNVLQLVRHDLLVLWGQNYGIQYLEKNAWVLKLGPDLGDAPQPYPFAWICPVLRLWPPPPLAKTPVYGPAYLFTHFSLEPI